MLEQLKKSYESYLELNPFQGKPQELYDAMNYMMSLGGKRIRPILTLLATRALDTQTDLALPAAHAMEVFHNFTLAHDDIMDEAPLRRNQPTLHIQTQTATAILAGDNMLIKAYERLLEFPSPLNLELVKLLNKTAAEICEGQQYDMNFEKQETVSIEVYIEMIRLKTAVLLGCCMQTGAIIANASSDIQRSFYHFGELAGIGFQIMDDYLDTFGTEAQVGKQIGGDILAAKKTALFCLAHKSANPEQQKQLTHLFSKETAPQERLTKTMALYHTLQVQDQARTLMEGYFDQANRELSRCGVSQKKLEPIFELVEFLKHRNM